MQVDVPISQFPRRIIPRKIWRVAGTPCIFFPPEILMENQVFKSKYINFDIKSKLLYISGYKNRSNTSLIRTDFKILDFEKIRTVSKIPHSQEPIRKQRNDFNFPFQLSESLYFIVITTVRFKSTFKYGTFKN